MFDQTQQDFEVLVVGYVSDDDLVMPRHLDAMVTALRHNDFVYPLPNFITIHREYGVPEGDLSMPEIKQRLLERTDFNFKLGRSRA